MLVPCEGEQVLNMANLLGARQTFHGPLEREPSLGPWNMKYSMSS